MIPIWCYRTMWWPTRMTRTWRARNFWRSVAPCRRPCPLDNRPWRRCWRRSARLGAPQWRPSYKMWTAPPTTATCISTTTTITTTTATTATTIERNVMHSWVLLETNCNLTQWFPNSWTGGVLVWTKETAAMLCYTRNIKINVEH